ncbi:hypothetical protein QFC22_001894 [Naganishia vaughanmartiniae]|uniref:Uncharacterized protein n=1 Tax=Naganishia vaughanmartiniae TaxID=1424756 RepID=A0ACC2XEK7_9TREE|nr:hypothetical protein QFC22_001894 [Naganishia vaughanmartiniae]
MDNSETHHPSIFFCGLPSLLFTREHLQASLAQPVTVSFYELPPSLRLYDVAHVPATALAPQIFTPPTDKQQDPKDSEKARANKEQALKKLLKYLKDKDSESDDNSCSGDELSASSSDSPAPGPSKGRRSSETQSSVKYKKLGAPCLANSRPHPRGSSPSAEVHGDYPAALTTRYGTPYPAFNPPSAYTQRSATGICTPKNLKEKGKGKAKKRAEGKVGTGNSDYASNSCRPISVVLHIDHIDGPDGFEALRTFFKACKHLSSSTLISTNPTDIRPGSLAKRKCSQPIFTPRKNGFAPSTSDNDQRSAERSAIGRELDVRTCLGCLAPLTASSFARHQRHCPELHAKKLDGFIVSDDDTAVSSQSGLEDKPLKGSRASVKMSASGAPDEPIDLEANCRQPPKAKRSDIKVRKQDRHHAFIQKMKEDLDKSTESGVGLHNRYEEFRRWMEQDNTSIASKGFGTPKASSSKSSGPLQGAQHAAAAPSGSHSVPFTDDAQDRSGEEYGDASANPVNDNYEYQQMDWEWLYGNKDEIDEEKADINAVDVPCQGWARA